MSQAHSTVALTKCTDYELENVQQAQQFPLGDLREIVAGPDDVGSIRRPSLPRGGVRLA